VSFYGINIFIPEILKSIFGAEDLIQLCWQTLLVQGLGIPACALAIWCLPRMGGRSLLLWGFIANGVTFLFLQVAYAVFPDSDDVTVPPNQPWLKFFLFACCMFALNWGTNLGTYIVPVASYPSGVRGTFHGLSAAAGKAGAALGAFLYPVVVNSLGNSRGAILVFFIQVIVNGLGVFFAYRFLIDDKPSSGGKAAQLDDDYDEQ
jgi:PHS family inorganic phosphate transporter-like MFS transporter